MISLFIFNKNKKENQVLEKCSKDAVALLSDDSLEIRGTAAEDEAEDYFQKKELLDAAFLDVTQKSGLTVSKEVRKNYEEAELMVIADATVSPMEYMTPAIRAASLLLRPYEVNQAKNVVGEFFRAVFRKREEADDEKVMVVENRQGKISIPFSKIYYMEVREKKIFVRLKEVEYSKYDSMENIIKTLPDGFLRCHRSFVVNTAYITRVKLSENMIYLEHDICVPLSRSYKGAIKEYMNGLRRL
ncbi:MAG: LytTR family transcriptional regulator DNA-binding domain-containing protein [Lachnospiraceae bacterium]|nr:LytTR family transcriptional regulator DNA-binding domain-containing protein [Lachnospiraceae bacterium]